MLKEFRAFIARGDVMDLAVGIIIGAAFPAIFNSLVNDLVTPLIGIFTGGVDFSNLFVALSIGSFATVTAAEAAGVAAFRYGSFLTAVINFLIVAWVVFLLAKAMSRIRAGLTPAGEEEAAGPTHEELLAETRNLLKTRVAPL